VRRLLLVNPRAGTDRPTTDELLAAGRGPGRTGGRRRSGERFELGAPDGQLNAALDGEPAVLKTPFEVAIEPGALRVLVPRAPDR
jgi:hypothetical protein